jgi:hypothetical protein
LPGWIGGSGVAGLGDHDADTTRAAV